MPKSNALEHRSLASPMLDPKPLEAIGRALRAHYDGLLQAPLPPRFQELLSRMEVVGQPARGKARDETAR